MTKFPDLPQSSGQPVFDLFNTSGLTLPVKEAEIQKAISLIESGESVSFSHIEFVFVNEDEIQEINKKHLSRDYVTDVISFRFDEGNSDSIEGTIYCCAQRIIEQSREFKTDEKEEFLRIIIHGLLHLSDYNDDTDAAKKQMTALEDEYLSKLV